MKPLTWSQIAQWSGGLLLQGTPAETVSALSTDTRSLKGGELFVALKGEKFDAHEFLEQALKAPAPLAGMLLHDLPLETESFGGAIVRVKDTLAGLQHLARNYRRSLGIPIVGITGSSGKTSTKDLVRAVLAQRWRVVATKGNLNNHIGVPLTLLSMDATTEAGVVEMGMNHSGEIEVLAEIAAPDGAIITNIGVAHIENLGSREAIALEKGMLAEAIEPGGWVVLPAQDDFTDSIRARCRAEVLTGGVEAGDVQARHLEIGWDGVKFDLSFGGESVPAFIPVPAEHMVRNATLAAAAGLRMGLSLSEAAAGLSQIELTGGRLQRKTVAGIAFIDDSYNANPESVKAALRTLRQLPVAGRRIAVLGRMAELGDHAVEQHVLTGRSAAENGIDILVGIGEEGAQLASGAAGAVETHVFADQAQVAAFLREHAAGEDLVLLKGSRSARMETVLSYLNEGI
jgi:UDP-N-acetylmuramoyl-tripeptide--D-alanyl-D-alanine ligase